MEVRYGRQTPTQSLILPYTVTEGQEAIDLYNTTGRTAQEWQELLESMIQNFSRRRAEETELSFDWALWLSVSSEVWTAYRKRNRSRFPKPSRFLLRHDILLYK